MQVRLVTETKPMVRFASCFYQLEAVLTGPRNSIQQITARLGITNPDPDPDPDPESKPSLASTTNKLEINKAADQGESDAEPDPDDDSELSSRSAERASANEARDADAIQTQVGESAARRSEAPVSEADPGQYSSCASKHVRRGAKQSRPIAPPRHELVLRTPRLLVTHSSEEARQVGGNQRPARITLQSLA
jgi:hypothetical protein